MLFLFDCVRYFFGGLCYLLFSVWLFFVCVWYLGVEFLLYVVLFMRVYFVV